MKKPKKIKIKEARDGDRALMDTTFWVVFIAALLLVLLKKFDTGSQAIKASAQLSTLISGTLLVISLLTSVRPIKVANGAKKCAVIATALWYAPSLLKNFEGDWGFESANLLPFAITEAAVCFSFWLFVKMVLSKRTW